MESLAVITPSLHLLGGLEGWRRTTGVLRAYASQGGLVPLLHPLDVPSLRKAMALAEYREARAEIRIGHFDQRVLCRVELSRWKGDRAALRVVALRPLPISAWWVDSRTFAGLPAMPSTLRA